MSRTRALPFMLDVLDQGLWLYRRHLRSFALVAASLLTVLAIGAMALSALIRTTLGDSEAWLLFTWFLALLLGYPLLLYAFAALSRAADAALAGRPIALRESLRLTPGRGCMMVIFNGAFAIITGIAAGALGFAFSCPLIFGLGLVGAVFSAFLLDSSSSAFTAVFSVFGQISMLWSMSIFGAWLAGLVFALQPFAIDGQGVRAALGRMAALTDAHVGRNLLMFIGAGAIFGTLTVIYTGSLIMLLVLISENVEITLPTAAGDAITIVLIVGSLVLLLPPLAIWMTIFHRRLTHERDGLELAARVDSWRAESGREPAHT
jgi:hypothetical protein